MLYESSFQNYPSVMSIALPKKYTFIAIFKTHPFPLHHLLVRSSYPASFRKRVMQIRAYLNQMEHYCEGPSSRLEIRP
ncbi:hypothetical protein E1A91_A03G087800v1 [Gossypium mustelinum]|uniref:Uncharacterized protein n=1 Tax=Gossypium mustelinum TaxID=34275 RepID=A0A5D2ZUR0_GOSMU|nr:hypothetical protein E1A91_A03G087800v1 [Gossypium mustelinum]